jgi:hypothetical protein
MLRVVANRSMGSCSVFCPDPDPVLRHKLHYFFTERGCLRLGSREYSRKPPQHKRYNKAQKTAV